MTMIGATCAPAQGVTSIVIGSSVWLGSVFFTLAFLGCVPWLFILFEAKTKNTSKQSRKLIKRNRERQNADKSCAAIVDKHTKSNDPDNARDY